MHFAKIKFRVEQEIGVDYAPGNLRNAFTAGSKVQYAISGNTCTAVFCAAGDGKTAPSQGANQ